MANVTIAVDLPPGVEITGDQRPPDGLGFAVRWPWPERGRCPRGGQEEHAPSEFTMIPQAVPGPRRRGSAPLRDLPGPLPSLGPVGLAPAPPPSLPADGHGRTDRFEPFVLRSLIGRTAAEVARRRGIAAATVERIVASQWAEDRPIDPQRGITDSGREELSLKKRHRLDVTWLTDRSDPERPPIWAGACGQDPAAALKGLDRHAEEQRPPVRTHRVDLGSASPAACVERLKNSHAVTDRFPGATTFNEVVDALRNN